MGTVGVLNKSIETIRVKLKDAGDKLCDRSWDCVGSRFAYDSIGYVNRGAIEITVNGSGGMLGSGGLYYIPAGSEYSHRVLGETANVLWTHFEMKLGSKNAADWLRFPVSAHTEDEERVLELFGRMFQAMRSDTPGAPLCLTGLMYELVSHFFSLCPGSITLRSEEKQRQMQKVIDYIGGHLHRAITVEELAALAGLAPNYFIETFRGVFHQTPIQFVLARREEAARSLLETSSLSIKEIGLSLGFSNQNYFSEFVKKRTGFSPLAYRALKK